MIQKSCIITDEILKGPICQSNWVSRRLYWGETGAKNWLAVVNEPNYPLRDPSKSSLHSNYLAALSGCAARTLVSLGPGDGRFDLALLRALREHSAPTEGRLNYIPVDLSRRLLEEAIANVQAEAVVPLGMCCDFENAAGFLADALEAHSERPVLFALLGGTVGNLDNGEEHFFNGMRGLLHCGDSFLIDFPLAGPGWSVASEPRLKVEAYTPVFRQFLSEGAFLADAPEGDRGREAAVERLQASFDDWVTFAHGQDAATGAEVITVGDRRAGRRVLVFRRYHWEPLLSWLEGRGFTIEFSRSSIVSEQDGFGMGVVVLTAPQSKEAT